MGYESIPKLIVKLSLPLMLSMLIQALYNVVDSIFVARVSENALTAVSLAYPLQSLMIAFGIGTAVGVNSYLARKLGEKRNDEAEAAANNGFFLAIITWLAFAIFGLFGTGPFISLFTEDEELLALTTEYASICLIFSFGIFIDITAERIMQATGDSIHPMIAQSLGAITNIILDPVFIFGFNMSVTGAAIATVLGQMVSMTAALIFVSRNKYIKLHLNLKKFRPSGRIIKEIYAVGVPTIIMNSVGTVSVSAMNSILISFTATAVSVLGVYFKLQSFIFMPVFGLQAGMIPIIAFNYGARKRGMILSTLKTGGTIAGRGQIGKAVAYHAGEMDVNEIIQSIPMLNQVAHIKEYQLMNVDSNEMTPQRWLVLSQKINELVRQDDIDGIVVTHGTDTLDETAYFLTLTLHTSKPVVVTGAMRPATATSMFNSSSSSFSLPSKSVCSWSEVWSRRKSFGKAIPCSRRFASFSRRVFSSLLRSVTASVPCTCCSDMLVPYNPAFKLASIN